MGWFDKKPQPLPAEPTPEEKAAAALAALTEKIEKTLASDASFMVMTVDGLAWICPYTGTRIPAPFGFAEPAREYLLKLQPWTKAKPKKLEELQQFRWSLWLKENIELEPRLRVFGPDGRWMNPFNGLWVRIVSRGVPNLTAEILAEIALALSRTPEAQKGPSKMLDKFGLDEAQKQGRFSSQHNLQPLDSGTHGTVKVSGSRAKSGDTGKVTSSASLGLDEDMDKAERIIAKMLAPLPAIDGYGLTVHYEPHSQVGGDFYECKEVAPGKWFICLADVTGHGVQGAMVVVGAIKSLRFVLKQEKDLVAILTRVNDEIRPDLLQGQFITMFAGILDAAERTFTCVCAGHHPSILISQTKKSVVEKIGNRGAALGLMSGEIFKRSLKPQVISLEPGDTVIMYTDGLTEVHNNRQAEYGDYRMMGTLLGNIEAPYDEVVATLVNDARNFASSIMEDDITVMSLSIEMPKEEAEEKAEEKS